MRCLQAAAWFEYLGVNPSSSSPVDFCSSTLLGDSISANSKDVVQQENLYTLWVEQGQAWQQCPPPKTPPSPTPASAAQHRKGGQRPRTAPATVVDGQGMCAEPISSDWEGQNSLASAAAGLCTDDPQIYPPVPVMQLPSRRRSGNPFASVQASLDEAKSSDAPAAAAAAVASQTAAGAVVPPLALHRLPAPFGSAPGHSSQHMQSRLGLESGMVLASSFTSATLSCSEVTSTGYATRSPSPDAGLKPHFLHAALSSHEEYGDATLAVSNPLFGCTPKRGNSPGMLLCTVPFPGIVAV